MTETTLLLLYDKPPSGIPVSRRFRFIPGNGELCIARGGAMPNPPKPPNIRNGSVSMLFIMWFCIWRIEFIVCLKKFRKTLRNAIATKMKDFWRKTSRNFCISSFESRNSSQLTRISDPPPRRRKRSLLGTFCRPQLVITADFQLNLVNFTFT